MPAGDNIPKVMPSGGISHEFDLQKWLFVILENRWWILGFSAFTTIVMAVYSFLVTPIYSSTATVYVQTQTRAPIGNQNLIGVTSWGEEMRFYNSQEQIIRSREVMQAVAERLQLQNHKAFKGLKDPAGALVGYVRVYPVKDSSLFQIQVKAPYKEDVALWANTIAEVYSDENLNSAMDYVNKANKIMIRQIDELQTKLTQLQRSFGTQVAKEGTYFPENQKQIIDDKIKTLESRINEIKLKESETSAIITQLESVLTNGGDPLSVPQVASDTVIQSLKGQLVTSEKELGQLLSKLKPKHPDVQKKQAEIESINNKILNQAKIILSSYRNMLQSYRLEEQGLMAQNLSAKSEGVNFLESSSKTTSLQTSIQSIEQYLNVLNNKVQELSVSASLLSNNIRLVDPATEPYRPVSPNRKANILFGFLFGLAASIGAIATIQIFDTRIKSTEDIEQGLGLNLLTMVPAIQAESQRASVEAYQTLRTALIYASQNKQQNVILITSANPKEGKSTVVINTGSVLAAGGDRVLLIDCDLRRPTLHRKFKPEAAVKGLTHYMADKEAKAEDFIVPVGVNLWIMYSGPIPPNPPELFSMKRFKELLNKMKQEFDWVIIDSPPALSLTDAQILATYSDLVLLVAKHKETHRPQLQRTIVTLERLNAQIAGVVMNYVDTSSSYYYDYYYYSSYYYTTGTSPKKLNWLFGLDLSRFQSLDKKFRRKKSDT
jgi:capsular exopolysaccharide synthesis family protein